MTAIDLFGQPVPDPPLPKIKGGYAATPGSGPPGETCRSCSKATPTSSPAGQRFWKCGQMRHHWTCGPGTDIRLKSPACRWWEPKSVSP